MKLWRENEVFVVDKVNEHIALNEGPVDVIFTTEKGTSFYCPNIYKCIDSARNNKGNNKADVWLVSTSEIRFKLSLKRHNAMHWQTGSYNIKQGEDLVKYVRKKHRRALTKINGLYELKHNIAIPIADEDEFDKVVFGSDIKETGCIIRHTFIDRNFEWEEASQTLLVGVTDIIKHKDHVPPDMQPYYIVRNDKRCRILPKFPGLRGEAVFCSRITTNTKLVEV